MFFGFSNESIFETKSQRYENVVNAYNFPKLFVSLQLIYTEIKPNKILAYEGHPCGHGSVFRSCRAA